MIFKTGSSNLISYLDHTSSSCSSGIVFNTAKEDSLLAIIKNTRFVSNSFIPAPAGENLSRKEK